MPAFKGSRDEKVKKCAEKKAFDPAVGLETPEKVA